MICCIRPVQIAVSALLLGLNMNGLQAQITWEFAEPLDVAENTYGNKCPRLVLDASGNPVVFMGKSNDGLYVVTSENGTFNTPQAVPTDQGIFLSDAEGPDVATWGNTIGLAYQISGQWITGALFMRSDDGGLTWSDSYPIAPNATEDHFMPIPAFDDEGNPFIGLKLGSGNSAEEGVLRSQDGGMTWGSAQPASIAAGNGIACECCPSRTLYGNGRYYSIYRRNDNNIRDMWLVSSEDGTNWNQQLDLDPTDWQLNACPATGASSAWLPDGRLASAFMSAGSGNSQVYLNLCDPVSNDAGATTALTFSQFSSINQNHPDVAVGPTHTVIVWEQSSGGWEIQLAIAPHDALPEGVVDVAVPLSESLSGSNRHPDVAVHGSVVHVIWQNTSDGTVKYLRGTLDGTSGLTTNSARAVSARLLRQGADVVTLEGAAPGSTYRILASHGVTLHEGQCDPAGSATLPRRFITPDRPLLVQVQTLTGPALLKLGLQP
jgi:hypothetical protein